MKSGLCKDVHSLASSASGLVAVRWLRQASNDQFPDSTMQRLFSYKTLIT